MTTSTMSDRALTSTCYDGHVILTPWAGTRFVPYQQIEQADHHRERVRSYIGIRGMNRLRTAPVPRLDDLSTYPGRSGIGVAS